MSVFTIGDIHLAMGDDSKKMDIFSGWENYSQRLKENWIKLVNDNDIVVLAGDISWGMKLQDTVKDFEFLNCLPGKKVILKGNHDLWWQSKNKIKNFFEQNNFNNIDIIYNNAVKYKNYNLCGTRGWMFADNCDDKSSADKIIARESGRLRFSLNDCDADKETIVFLHYPPIYNDYVIKEFIDILKEYNIKECYYGHIHAKGCNMAFNGVYEGIKFKLISADFLKFTPYFIGN
ncbi:MAG: metallophosphoesterase [Oscillospiraceae bacterium]